MTDSELGELIAKIRKDSDSKFGPSMIDVEKIITDLDNCRRTIELIKLGCVAMSKDAIGK